MNEPLIKKVANGYLVYPNQDGHTIIDDNEVYVFETWEKTIEHLYNKLNSKENK